MHTISLEANEQLYKSYRHQIQSLPEEARKILGLFVGLNLIDHSLLCPNIIFSKGRFKPAPPIPTIRGFKQFVTIVKNAIPMDLIFVISFFVDNMNNNVAVKLYKSLEAKEKKASLKRPHEGLIGSTSRGESALDVGGYAEDIIISLM